MPDFLLLLLVAVAVQVTSLGSASKNVASENHVLGKLGAIIDPSCNIGKEAKIAMEMAVEDFHHSNGSKLSIHMRDSHGNPLQDASTIVCLVEEEQVLAVVGSLTWQEAAMINNASRKTMDVPILSFVTSPITQPTMHKRRPPIIQLATDVSMHMKCISAIIESHGWRIVHASGSCGGPYRAQAACQRCKGRQHKDNPSILVEVT